jgi:hypothetical protein
MYTGQILWFLALPVMIYLSYLAASWMIRRFEKMNANKPEE